MNRSVILKALTVTAFCFSMGFAQPSLGKGPMSPVGAPPPPPPPPPPAASSGNAIAAYVYGEENAANAEELADALVTNLANSRNYNTPRRGAREFFRAADREQARNRGKMLEDRNFCRIGGDFGVQFVVLIDIERAGRGNSIYARILDLNNCVVVATGEFTGLLRNNAEITNAANNLSGQLLKRQMFRRGGGAMAAPTPPPPPPPPPRGNQIAGYVFGMENAKLGEDLADAIVNGLVSGRNYSQPRRGARGFFKEVEKVEERLGRRGKLLDDKDFCKIGSDYEIEYLVIIDIERAGRGNSVWARIIDLETCKIIATGESTALIRNDAEVASVANEIVKELNNRRIGTRGRR